MAQLFHELLYRPLFNLMIFFYTNVPGADIGIAIILTTVVVRILMLPLYRKGLKSQREMAVVQPKIREIQATYKDDKQKLSEELMKVYQEHNINPFAGILILLAQIPIILAMYRVSLNIFKPETYPELYPFVNLPAEIEQISFGFLNVANSARDVLMSAGIVHALPSIVLVLLVGATQYGQIRLIMGRNKGAMPQKTNSDEPDMALAMQKQMGVVMPTIITIIAFTLPVAMSLYWITTTLATVAQEFVLIRSMKQKS